jgi:hypothetical protein
LLTSSFLACSSSQEGGAVLARVVSIRVRAMSGWDCSSEKEAAFGAFGAQTLQAQSPEINESRGVRGRCTMAAFQAAATADVWIQLRSVHVSHNYATLRASALEVGARLGLQWVFCSFRSNWQVNTVTMSPPRETREVFQCLEFWNNTAKTGADQEYQGMISITAHCEFQYCFFLDNHADALIGQYRAAGSADPGQRDVSLIHCVVTLPSVWGTQGVVIATAPNQIYRPGVVGESFFTVCPNFRDRDYCVRYSCSQSGCPTDIYISFCLFEECQTNERGGAVFVSNVATDFQVVTTRFVACTAAESGGSAWLSVSRARLNAVFADRCWSPQQSFGDLNLNSAHDNSNEVNDTALVSGWSERSSLHLVIWGSSVVHPIKVIYLNSTLNFATQLGSGLDLGDRRNFSLSFCHFTSNSPSNTLTLWKAASNLTDVYHCLEFYNNTVTSGQGSAMCLIYAGNPCEFQDCAFVKNTLGFLLGQSDAESPVPVRLVRCIFDAWPDWQTLGVSWETESCAEKPQGPFELPGQRCGNDGYIPTATESDLFESSDTIHPSVAIRDSFVLDNSATITTSFRFGASSPLRDSFKLGDSPSLRDSFKLGSSSPLRHSFKVDDSFGFHASFRFDASSAFRGSFGFSDSSVVRGSFGFDHSVPLVSGIVPATGLPFASGDFGETKPFSVSDGFLRSDASNFSRILLPSRVIDPSGKLPNSPALPLVPPKSLVETRRFTGSIRLGDGDRDRGGEPESKPAYLWIGIGAGIGFLVLVALAIAILLFVRRRGRSATEAESSEVALPVEASWEASVLPAEEFVESFNPVASSGEGSGDEFAVVSDEAAPV